MTCATVMIAAVMIGAKEAEYQLRDRLGASRPAIRRRTLGTVSLSTPASVGCTNWRLRSWRQAATNSPENFRRRFLFLRHHA